MALSDYSVIRSLADTHVRTRDKSEVAEYRTLFTALIKMAGIEYIELHE